MMKRFFFLTALMLATLTSMAQDRPKLVVGIAVDQMRWDYLYYYYPQFGPDGLRRLVAVPGGGGLVGGGMPVIVQSLYLGLMGFLILSGYFYRPRGFKTNMGKRLKQIAVPLAIGSLTLPLILWSPTHVSSNPR